MMKNEKDNDNKGKASVRTGARTPEILFSHADVKKTIFVVSVNYLNSSKDQQS